MIFFMVSHLLGQPVGKPMLVMRTVGSCWLVGIATGHISKGGQFGDGIVSVLVAITECLQEAI